MPKLELADIFQRYGPLYLSLYGDWMLPSHKRALFDIAHCRTDVFGGHMKECNQCGYTHYFEHSCYNRSCPKCNGIRTQDWFGKREAELLPVTYFHIIFTLPEELRYRVRSDQNILLDILMKASAYAIKKVAANPQFAGGIPGILMVLHTWTRIMEYHPHTHCLVPAVVISKNNSNNSDSSSDSNGFSWLPTRKKNYLAPLPALSSIFRARFVKLARKALKGKDIKLPHSIWEKDWVVFSGPALKGAKGSKGVLKYLARYIYRSAITNTRIISDNNGSITFKYRHSKTRIWQETTLPAIEFIRRFLQHVLPIGFHKVRYYGFLAPSYHPTLWALKLTLESKDMMNHSSNNNSQPHQFSNQTYKTCPKCKIGLMVVILKLSPKREIIRQGRSPP